MATHAMIDIETLGTEPDSVILSVGAVKFDPFTFTDPHAKTLWRPSADEQMTADRSVLEDTLKWWSKQPQHIQDEAFSEDDRQPLVTFFGELNKYLVLVQCCKRPSRFCRYPREGASRIQ